MCLAIYVESLTHVKRFISSVDLICRRCPPMCDSSKICRCQLGCRRTRMVIPRCHCCTGQGRVTAAAAVGNVLEHGTQCSPVALASAGGVSAAASDSAATDALSNAAAAIDTASWCAHILLWPPLAASALLLATPPFCVHILLWPAVAASALLPVPAPVSPSPRCPMLGLMLKRHSALRCSRSMSTGPMAEAGVRMPPFSRPAFSQSSSCVLKNQYVSIRYRGMHMVDAACRPSSAPRSCRVLAGAILTRLQPPAARGEGPPRGPIGLPVLGFARQSRRNLYMCTPQVPEQTFRGR